MFPYPKDSGGLGAFPKMPQKQYIQYFLDHWPTIINPTLLFPVDWDVKTTSWSKRECTSSSTESYITALLRPVFKAVPIFRSYKRCICYLYQRRPPCGSPMFVFHCNYWVARFRVRPVIISVFGCLCWKTVFRGEGRHGGLVTRNYVLTNGFIPFFFALTLRRIFFVPRLRAPPPSPPRNPEGVANQEEGYPSWLHWSNFEVSLLFWVSGNLPTYVSGNLPTYPSPKLTFCPKWEASVTVGLGEE